MGGFSSLLGGAGKGFDPVSMIASIVIGQAVSGLLAPKKQDAPAPQAAAPAPQASKTPEVAAVQRQTADAAGTENSTLLTGLGGVDPKKLNLGGNTLLGA